MLSHTDSLKTHSDDAFVTKSEFSQLLNSIVVPRPIALVTTIGQEGVINAAPFSYFNVISKTPSLISLSVQMRGNELKDTARNIFEKGEFVVNICSFEMVRAIDVCGGDFPSHVSEVELSRLSLIPSQSIQTPRIANTLVQMECKLFQRINLDEGAGDLIIGKVVKLHVHKEILTPTGRIDIKKLNPVARLSGAMYARLSDIVDLAIEKNAVSH